MARWHNPCLPGNRRRSCALYRDAPALLFTTAMAYRLLRIVRTCRRARGAGRSRPARLRSRCARRTSKPSSSRSAAALVPGETNTVALRLKIRDRWHTYWRNPGDSGLPTTLDWKLPAGVTRRRDPVARAQGAAGGTARQLRLRRRSPSSRRPRRPREPAAGTAGDAEGARRLAGLRGRVHSGRRGSVARAARRSEGRPDPRWSASIKATRDALPKPLAGWQAQAIGEGQTSQAGAHADGCARGEPGTLRFFPFGEGAIEPSGAQTLARDGERARAHAAGCAPARAGLHARRRRHHLGQRHRRREGRDDRRADDRKRRRRSEAARRAGAEARPERRRRDVVAVARRRAAVRFRRRLAAEPDAVRVSGAVAQGHGLRRASRRQADDASRSGRVQRRA